MPSPRPIEVEAASFESEKRAGEGECLFFI